MRKLTSSNSAAVILLVQPCDDGRDMYVEFLRHHGFAVMGIPDAWDALTVAPDADVIVTGILLASSIDGHELIARLRNDGRTNQTPIIVLTACAWTTERERAERAGCDVFLEKPCLPSDLLRHVRDVLTGSKLRRVPRAASQGAVETGYPPARTT